MESTSYVERPSAFLACSVLLSIGPMHWLISWREKANVVSCLVVVRHLDTFPGVGVRSPVSTRQDMGRTIRGGPAHKIKACMALLGVYCKILYSTKYATFLVTLPLQSI